MKNNTEISTEDTYPPVLEQVDPLLDLIRKSHPPQLIKGKGAYVVSQTGEKYIDCALAWGAILLGHADKKIEKAIIKQLKYGTLLGGASLHSFEIAAKIKKLYPCGERVRFGKNGSDATLGAVRLARSYTGREKIARCGYHGFHDWSLADDDDVCRRGVPKSLRNDVLKFEFNNVDSLMQVTDPYKNEIAAIMIEPMIGVIADYAFLKKARDIADEIGAVLIFDEILTGFRIASGGIQEIHNVTPDIVCLGKSIANGMPLSIIAGKEKIMNEFRHVWYGLTFEQEALSMAAANEFLDIIIEKNIAEEIGRNGRILKNEFKRLSNNYGIKAELIGPDQKLVPKFYYYKGFGSALCQTMIFYKSMFEKNIILNNAIFLSYAHKGKVINKIIEAFEYSFKSIVEIDKNEEYYYLPSMCNLKSEIKVEKVYEKDIKESWIFDVKLKNIGDSAWYLLAKGVGQINLGVQLYDEDKTLIERDYYRYQLMPETDISFNNEEVEPQKSINLQCNIPTPENKGTFFLEFDMVCEGICWFKENRSIPHLERVEKV